MITERTIINGLIIGASFIIVPFVISQAVEIDLIPALILGTVVAGALGLFVMRDTLAIWPFLGGSVLGSLNFLPIPLGATQIFSILLIIYYITGYVIIKQAKITLRNTIFMRPILVVVLIVLYHNHNLHIKGLGTAGSEEGDKPAVLIYLAVAAYFCGINVRTASVDFLSKIPRYSVILTAVSSLPFVLTTFIPSLAPYLYYITNTVNVQAYAESISSSGSDGYGVADRMGAFGPLGGAIQLYLLCYYPIGTWLRPDRWWVILVTCMCAYLVMMSGYRNILFGYIMLMMLATYCFYTWRAFALPVAFFMAGLFLYAASDNGLMGMPLNKLPLIAQRSLSFLPGNWDQQAIDSAAASNDFRKNIQDVYIQEYLNKSPLIGNGFTIDTEAAQRWQSLMSGPGGSALDHRYAEAKGFIEGKLFHTGWISVYDCVGIVGTVAFVALGLIESMVAWHFVFGPNANRRSSLFPTYVWLLCGILPSLIGFFTTFGDFAATFTGFCINAIVLSHLLDIEKQGSLTPAQLGSEIRPTRQMPVSAGA